MPIEETRHVDMSPAAVDQRLRDLGQLYRLGMSLRGIKPLSKSTDLKKREDEQLSLPSGLSHLAASG